MMGYGALLSVYVLMLLPAAGPFTLVLSIVFMGGYYAATDGVVAALTSAVVDPRLRATGLALVGSANDVGKIASGLAFGWLWSQVGIEASVGIFAALLLAMLIVAGPPIRRFQADADAEPRP
jgi:predicted MFS family arabinose efflux permease